jgi:hypothetical protein
LINALTSFGKAPKEFTALLSSLLQLIFSYPSTSLTVRTVSATEVEGDSSLRKCASRFVLAVEGGGIASCSRSEYTDGVRGARETAVLRGVPFIGRAGDENMPGYSLCQSHSEKVCMVDFDFVYRHERRKQIVHQLERYRGRDPLPTIPIL